MIELINNIIENKENNFFHFYFNFNNPVKHLKEQTHSVPDRSGLYLIFSEKKHDSFDEGCQHLKFPIEQRTNELLYFGKAGGLTNENRIIRQGLKCRINNVISDRSRNLKDIKRANYWNIIMNEFNFQKFTIIFLLNDTPQLIENAIYSYLDEHNLKYPLMNKKRGRSR